MRQSLMRLWLLMLLWPLSGNAGALHWQTLASMPAAVLGGASVVGLKATSAVLDVVTQPHG